MLTGCRSVMAVLDRPGVLDDPHLRAYITREQERLGAMARALGTFPQPYTSHALVIGAGFGREWTPELAGTSIHSISARLAGLTDV
jgi:hypothetical protein